MGIEIENCHSVLWDEEAELKKPVLGKVKPQCTAVKVLADIFYYGIKRRGGGIGDNSFKQSETTVEGDSLDLNADILTNK